jgi:hypothetical protein
VSLHEIASQLDALDTTGAIRPHTPGIAPDRHLVIRLIKELQALLFPGYFRTCGEPSTESRLALIHELLLEQMTSAISFGNGEDKNPLEATNTFISRLPVVKELLLKDIDALYEGDPCDVLCVVVAVLFGVCLCCCVYLFNGDVVDCLEHSFYLLKINPSSNTVLYIRRP